MADRGLRDFLERIETAGDLRRVTAAVDPLLEIAAITDRVGKKGGPALRFERVAGHPFPVLTNLFGSPRRMAEGLGVADLGALTDRLESELPEGIDPDAALRDLTGRFASEILGDAPCREVTEEGPAGLDLLPALKSWPEDGGRFLTLPLVFTRHPETGGYNCGIYRMQLIDGRRAAMHWRPGAGGAGHFESWSRRGERMPVAVALGGDPALLCAAAMPLPAGIDEMAFAGYLRRRPLAATACRDSDLQAPAAAEFLLEGFIEPGESFAEGPFGNHTGHYAPPAPCPVFHLTSFTRRRDALYPATVVGPPPMENVHLAKAAERIFLPLLRRRFSEIVDIEMPLTTIFHGCALVKVRELPQGAGREFIRELWRTDLFRSSRLLILLDESADLANNAECYWRIVNRVDADRDLVVEGRKLGVDATAAPPGPPVVLDEATRRLVERRWEEYGID